MISFAHIQCPARSLLRLPRPLRKFPEHLGGLLLTTCSRFPFPTAQKYADYENEIRVLQAQLRQQERRHAAAIAAQPPDATPPPPPDKDRPGISRTFGSFISRKPIASPTLSSPSTPTAAAREQELKAALAKEQQARIEAENKAKQVHQEIEELSATLFQQANEMVANERRENAELKQRIQTLEAQSGGRRATSDDAVQMENAALRERMRLLEKKSSVSVDDSVRVENERLKQKLQVLEQREVERRRRLERLEAAQKRIDRVRAMLVPR